MGRIRRSRMGFGVYHVLNRGINRSWILSTEEEKDAFLTIVVDQSAMCDLNIYHWVLMSNHFHLVVEALSSRGLSAFLGKVCSLYSRWHHSGKGGSGTLWQGRFRSVAVEKEDYLFRLGRYVERNPLRAQLDDITVPWEYKWSSCRAYVETGSDALVRAAAHPYWRTLGDDDQARRDSYKQYVEADDESDRKLFRSAAAAVGSDNFITNLRLIEGRMATRKVGRPKKRNGII